MRYIDDLLTLNNPAFDNAIDDIYPPELQLKKTTECPTTLSYLDILITIDNGKYSNCDFRQKGQFHIQHRELSPFQLKYPVKASLWSVHISASMYW